MVIPLRVVVNVLKPETKGLVENTQSTSFLPSFVSRLEQPSCTIQDKENYVKKISMLSKVFWTNGLKQ